MAWGADGDRGCLAAGFLGAEEVIDPLYAASGRPPTCMISGMDRTERFYKIERMLREQRVVTFATMMERLEVSRATLKRDLEYLRNRLHAPIEYDREAGGDRLSEAAASNERYE